MTDSTLSVLIVDDEPPARERLLRLVGELPGWTVAGTCGTGRKALEEVERLAPAVVLLDIRMPGMSGIEAARHLNALAVPPAIVFTTAYDRYALEAFDSQAVDYLLKPVRRKRLRDALQRAARLAAPTLARLAQSAPGLVERRHVAVRTHDRLELVPVEEILYFRADHKYVTIRHRNGDTLTEEPLKALADEFAARFVRIHRAVLVAVAAIEALEKLEDGNYRVRLRHTGEYLPVSRRRAVELKARLNAGR